MTARPAAAACLAAALAGACGDPGSPAPDASGGAGEERGERPARSVAPAGEITVFAAASLTQAFRELAAEFERRRPGVSVTLNLAGSQVLAGQLLQGAPADVFASADARQMRRVVEAGLPSGEPRVFATSELVVAVRAGNPRRVSGLADLAREDVVAVLAAPGAPAGAYARRALRAAGVELRPASLETDVKQVLARVALGEADAGLVYRTDVRAAGSAVEAVRLPPAHRVSARYPVAALRDAPRPDVARAFTAFLLGPEARAVLSRHGFGAP